MERVLNGIEVRVVRVRPSGVGRWTLIGRDARLPSESFPYYESPSMINISMINIPGLRDRPFAVGKMAVPFSRGNPGGRGSGGVGQVLGRVTK